MSERHVTGCVLISNSVNIKSIDVWKKCQCICQIQVDCELGKVDKLCEVVWTSHCIGSISGQKNKIVTISYWEHFNWTVCFIGGT